MSKRVVMVGHCGPDASFLRMAISSAAPGTKVVLAETQSELDSAVQEGVDLVLLNRVIDYGFETTEGVELLRSLKQRHPDVPVMMVSNYEEAQQEAEAAGGLPGFGKREIGGEKVRQRLAAALGE